MSKRSAILPCNNLFCSSMIRRSETKVPPAHTGGGPYTNRNIMTWLEILHSSISTNRKLRPVFLLVISCVWPTSRPPRKALRLRGSNFRPLSGLLGDFHNRNHGFWEEDADIRRSRRRGNKNDGNLLRLCLSPKSTYLTRESRPNEPVRANVRGQCPRFNTFTVILITYTY